MARPRDYPRTREAEKTWENLSANLISARVSQPFLIACTKCKKEMLQQHSDKFRERDNFFLRIRFCYRSRKGQSVNLNCFLASKILASMARRMNAWMDKKGSREPPPDDPSRGLANLAKLHLIHCQLMRLDPSNPSLENARSNASTSIRAQMGEGTNNERVPRRCLLLVLPKLSTTRCICCACPTFSLKWILFRWNLYLLFVLEIVFLAFALKLFLCYILSKC